MTLLVIPSELADTTDVPAFVQKDLLKRLGRAIRRNCQIELRVRQPSCRAMLVDAQRESFLVRVALVIQKLIASHGGAESWTVQLARWLAERNHHVHCYCLRSSDLGCSDRLQITTLSNNRNRFAAADELANQLSSQKFDIVHDMGLGTNFDIFQSHIGSLKAIEKAKRLSVSPIRRIADQLLHPFSTRKRQLYKQAVRQFSHPTAWYVAVSNMVAKGLEGLERVPSNRIFTIGNGVDIDRFHPNAIESRRVPTRQKWSIGPNELVLLTMAHNHRLKGVPQLVEFLRRAKDLPCKMHLMIAGGHNQTPEFLSVGEHKVTFLGPIAEPLDAYGMADIYIHPTFYDACSLSVLEAMACGLPTIASRCNGATERIRHGRNGFLIESARDEYGITKSLTALASFQARQNIGKLARQNAEQWTLEDNFLSIELLYEAKRESNLTEYRRDVFKKPVVPKLAG